jgi:hypothetical protein
MLKNMLQEEDDCKKLAKKIRNRAHARESRLRQKQKQRDLERHLQQLLCEVEQLQAAEQKLLEENAALLDIDQFLQIDKI